jgi:hypothetical protein
MRKLSERAKLVANETLLVLSTEQLFAFVLGGCCAGTVGVLID